MMTIVDATDDTFWNKFEELSDKRTKGWLLVDSPINVASIILAYLLMVWLGPKMMAKQKPFQIKGLLALYNFFLVLLNVAIIREVFVGTSRRGYNYFCHRSMNDYHPEEMRILGAIWWFYISKYIEFCDTLFFILRKKTDQLSGLHIYHHCTMSTYCWTVIKWYPSGASARLIIMNCLVHIAMYMYYGLSACGPNVQKHLWWKKYLTSAQLVQFVISLAWALHSLIKGCNHHYSIDLFNIVYMCTFLYLFGKFYVRKYTKKVV